MSIIDSKGFRENIGIIIINDQRRLFWARRCGMNAWQFPQGGVHEGETVEDTLFRELEEEVGLSADDVKIVTCTQDWLYYRLPEKFMRKNSKPLCVGQKQKYFLLQLTSDEQKINLAASDSPEFDKWRWVTYWYPLRQVIDFKREVYRKALQEFIPSVFHSDD